MHCWTGYNNNLLWFLMQINDRYEFPLELDLDREGGKYLSPDADKSVRNLYTLHRYKDFFFLPVINYMNLFQSLLVCMYALCHEIKIPRHLLFALHAFVVYSVLVHSGGVHGGHYYAFIRPTLSDQWWTIFFVTHFVCLFNSMFVLVVRVVNFYFDRMASDLHTAQFS